MAIEKEIKIKVSKGDADKDIKDVDKSLNKLDDSAKKAGETANKSLDKTEKGAKKTSKSLKLVSSGFKGIGTAIKAAGIGLVISLFASLAVAMSKNQKVIDFISTAFETLGIYMGKVSEVIVNIIESTSKSTENFDALGKVIGGLITVFLTPLKLAFYAIKLGVNEAQLAWEKSVFGGKDQETIKNLEIAINETKDSIKEVADEAVNAGSEIISNFSEAVTEVGAITTKVVDEVSKVSLKASYEQAKLNVALKNTALLAVAEQSRLVEIYDRQAEQQRQIRDDVAKSLPERTKANNELLKVLESQEKAMLAQADAQIASAQAELNKNKNIENQVALTEALANKEGILAQVEGFRSEQIVNRISLLQEEKDLKTSIYESEEERAIAQKEFETEQEENELERFERRKELLTLEEESAIQALERQKEIYNEGTQARVDAEQEYLTKKQELEQRRTLLEKQEAEKRKTIDKAVQDAKLQIAGRTLGLLGSLLQEGSDLAKGVAVAQATISGIEGVQNAFTTASKNPITTVFPAFPYIQAGLAGAFSAVQIGKILSTDSSGGGSSPSAGGNEGISAPSFNVVAGTGENQIAESIQSQNAQPVQAFVVSRSVTTGQEFDRNIEGLATL